MIRAATDLPEGHLSADVVVVGSGVNGAVLAAELGRRGRRVVLLEAGHDDGGEAWVAEVDGAPFEGAAQGRRRGFGGTGAWWAGQCAPFSPLDLEQRPWVAHSGWPITWDELAPWYPPASRAMGLGTADLDDAEVFGPAQWTRRGVTPPGGGLEHRFSAFLARPDVAAGLREEFARSTAVTVVTGAPVVAVHRHPTSERVGGVEVAPAPGVRRRIEAPLVVLAAGGIETARLLLLSTDRDPAGLGNGHDLVGRYLHDHPSGVAARVEPIDPRRLRDLYGMLYAPRSTDRTRNWARIPLSDAAQRTRELLGATATAVFDDEGGTLDGLKAVVRRTSGSHPLEGGPGTARLLRGAVAGLPAVPGVAWRRYARGLSPAAPATRTWLRTAAEQPPRADSRVTLSDVRDAAGLPLARVRWQLGEEEREAQRALVGEVARAWGSAGLAVVTPLPWLGGDADGTGGGDGGWRAHQVDAYHHSGTARMSASPRSGVVDRDLQVHGVPGLHVAGSAVFPTSSSSNPTYTSVALTLRLARHLAAGA